jgi:hypothetical protein
MKQVFTKTIFLVGTIILACASYGQTNCVTSQCSLEKTYVVTSQTNFNNDVNNINNTIRPHCFINVSFDPNPITIGSNINWNNFYQLSFSGNGFIVNQTVDLNNHNNVPQVLISNGYNHFANISIGKNSSIYIDGDFSVNHLVSNNGGHTNNVEDTNYIYMTATSTFSHNGVYRQIGSKFRGNNTGTGTWIVIRECLGANTPLSITINSFKYSNDNITWDIKDMYQKLELMYSADGKFFDVIADVTYMFSYRDVKSGFYKLKITTLSGETEYSDGLKVRNNKEERPYVIYDFNGNVVNENEIRPNTNYFKYYIKEGKTASEKFCIIQ